MNGQDPILDLGPNLLLIHDVWHRKPTFKSSIWPFSSMVPRAFIFTILLPITRNHEHLALDRQIDIFLFHSGKLGPDPKILVGFQHIRGCFILMIQSSLECSLPRLDGPMSNSGGLL